MPLRVRGVSTFGDDALFEEGEVFGGYGAVDV
jgi:hypothetical protein